MNVISTVVHIFWRSWGGFLWDLDFVKRRVKMSRFKRPKVFFHKIHLKCSLAYFKSLSPACCEELDVGRLFDFELLFGMLEFCVELWFSKFGFNGLEKDFCVKGEMMIVEMIDSEFWFLLEIKILQNTKLSPSDLVNDVCLVGDLCWKEWFLKKLFFPKLNST